MRRAHIIQGLAASIIAVLAVWMLLMLNSPPQAFSSDPGAQPPQAGDLAAALLRSGLSPGALAAAGVQSEEIPAVVTAAHETLLEQWPELPETEAQHAAALAQAEHLRRLIRSGAYEEGATDEYATASQSAAAAAGQRDAALQAVLEAGLEQISASQAQTVQTIRANSNWTLPTEFLVLALSHHQWLALREALANERTAAALGEEPDLQAQALIEELSAEPAVAMAQYNLETHLQSVTDAWNDAVEIAAAE